MCTATTDLSRIDTTPGVDSPFAPPADFAGGEEGYDRWLEREYRYGSPVFPQMMFVLTRLIHGTAFIPVEITGPYASRLQAAVRRMHMRLKSDADKERAAKAA